MAGGRSGFAFAYLNLRITPGRSRALVATVNEHFTMLHAERPLGITLHIDEVAPAYEGKFSNLAAHLASGQAPT